MNIKRRDNKRSSSRMSRSKTNLFKRSSTHNSSIQFKDRIRHKSSRRSIKRLGGDSMQIKYYKRKHKARQSFADSQKSELMSRTSYSGSYSGSEDGSGSYSYYSDSEEESLDDETYHERRTPKPSQYNNAYYSDNDSVADPREAERKMKKKLASLSSFASSLRSSRKRTSTRISRRASRRPSRLPSKTTQQDRGGYCTDSEQVITVRQKEQYRARMHDKVIHRGGNQTDAEGLETDAEEGPKGAISQRGFGSRDDLAGRPVGDRNFIPERVKQYNHWWFL